MSIEQKIADLLKESAKLKALDDESKLDRGLYLEEEDEEEIIPEVKPKRKRTSKKVIADNCMEDVSPVQEDIDALVYGEDLSEEFKLKATTIFEAAVLSRVKEEVSTLEEAFEERLEEATELAKEDLVEKIDSYLSYIVEEWMSNNEIAVEQGLKTDILEGFVGGLKSLFQEHYIEVPEERFDVMEDLQQQVTYLESKLDESLDSNVSMKKQLTSLIREGVVEAFCDELTDTDVEKFKSLAEELSYSDVDTFSEKLEIIKENYFSKYSSSKTTSVVTDKPVHLTEGTKTVDHNVARYLESFNRIKI
jgi:hypothetical protein